MESDQLRIHLRIDKEEQFIFFMISLFQALCQCGRLKKRTGDERGQVEKEGATGSRSHPLVARSLFRSSLLTESLEQVIL